jgi:hypothetical protein
MKLLVACAGHMAVVQAGLLLFAFGAELGTGGWLLDMCQGLILVGSPCVMVAVQLELDVGRLHWMQLAALHRS